MSRWYGFLLILLLPTAPAAAQPSSKPGPQPSSPHVEETVEVVAVTPLHGSGVPLPAVPSNVQVIRSSDVPGTTDLATLLSEAATGVHKSEAQGGTFQPDLLFRGFTASPLLGASEGLAVYIDGVRSNEPFGDVVNWDALPTAAIGDIQLMPGANPLFGHNALGGAISIRSRDGFATDGGGVSLSGGSFGRYRAEADWGAHRGPFGVFVAGSWLTEDGWRDHSPTDLRRVFAKGSWKGTDSRADLSVSLVSNDLIGNGTVPGLLMREEGRSAVFTHPDRTDHDLTALTARFERLLGQGLRTEATAYVRPSRLATLNGDAAEDDDDDDDHDGDHDDDDDDDDDDDEQFDIGYDGVLNRSRTRTNAIGGAAQLVATHDRDGRFNQLILGADTDFAWTTFGFSAEHAYLTANRSTLGVGDFDDDAAVGLKSRRQTFSVFLSDTYRLAPTLHATASARVAWTTVRLRDQIGTSLNGDHKFQRLNPAIGLTWGPSSSVNVFGGYQQSSRVPTPVELTCADPEDPCRLPNAFVSDPPLEQVVAGTWEGGVRARAGRLSGTAALFHSRVSDDIIFVGSGRARGEGHFENVDSTRRRGLEARADYRVGPTNVFGTYTYQVATYGTDLRIASPNHPEAVSREISVAKGATLPGVPRHVGRVGVSSRIARAFDVAVSTRFQSSQYLRGDESNQLEPLEGFGVVDARLRWQLRPRVAVVGQVVNLFDRTYETFGMLGEAEFMGPRYEDERRFVSPGMPRAAWVGVDLRF